MAKILEVNLTINGKSATEEEVIKYLREKRKPA